ncbi:hypothetical protein [Paucibacter sp. B51]|uniref:hypothetical protein n=1 Tax=Paucibacter sp. B51 TaxID=2993315 RepID=UPI0022EBCC88|nr:hypothetical protein [Paucibacter sp. B51]
MNLHSETLRRLFFQTFLSIFVVLVSTGCGGGGDENVEEVNLCGASTVSAHQVSDKVSIPKTPDRCASI